MLVLENIRVTFDKGKVLENRVLDDLFLSVKPGEFVVILGANGSGKSTIFNVVCGDLKQDQGKVIVDNYCCNSMRQDKQSRLMVRVNQDPRLGTMENLTILENMSFAFRRGMQRGFAPYDSAYRRQLFSKELAVLEMGLENRLDHLVVDLSGGERQALSLIMALLNKVKILLLDEITAALDPLMAKKVMQITAKIVQDRKITTIMITHNINHAIAYGDRVIILSKGKIAKQFSPEDKPNLTIARLEAELN